MPETMVERVAKALSVADGMHPDAVSNDEDSTPIWTRYIKDARAALQALREPPASYMKQNPPYWLKSGWYPGNDVRKEIWQQMIDAALSEGAER